MASYLNALKLVRMLWNEVDPDSYPVVTRFSVFATFEEVDGKVYLPLMPCTPLKKQEKRLGTSLKLIFVEFNRRAAISANRASPAHVIRLF